ncbi:WD40 repeat-like protein [Sporormia fimetaria CBS 119925]|uniref:WD40 repeat-like protein n=1 Tax=Sporormia fimetaria CBS 119925 TaxID=1340428 RepID=A0A6A6VNT7_9PLEO|nr:WD40 repeat-like protein [Sporormia fimetaria CBS 119925]
MASFSSTSHHNPPTASLAAEDDRPTSDSNPQHVSMEPEPGEQEYSAWMAEIGMPPPDWSLQPPHWTPPPMPLSGSYPFVVSGASFEEFLDEHISSMNVIDTLPLPPLDDMLWDTSGSAANWLSHIDNDSELPPFSDYLKLLNKDRFLPISSFFRRINAQGNMFTMDAVVPKDVVTYGDLRGDECDIQGINWKGLNTTRAAIRDRRTKYEADRLLNGQMKAVRQGMVQLPNQERFFSFKQMNTRHKLLIPHFQLRNLLAVPSRNNIFYASGSHVHHTDASGGPPTIAMDLKKAHTGTDTFKVTTLAADRSILIAGGFEGEYAITNLHSPLSITPNLISRTPNRTLDAKSHITNHIHLSPSRTSYTPRAILASNDHRLRTLDIPTNTITQTAVFPMAVNCTATSPDSRLRVAVGDFNDTYIISTDSGEVLQKMQTHTDEAFACDWSDDGRLVATAAQDSTIVVWDSRNWNQPLKVLYSELSVPRVVKFSPTGEGERVLVIGEADDFLSVVDAVGFEGRQVFDFFGQVAGLGFAGDGRGGLFVGVEEEVFGGVLEFERCEWGSRRRQLDRGDEEREWEDEDEQESWGRGSHRRGSGIAGLVV